MGAGKSAKNDLAKPDRADRQELILDAVIRLLAAEGISGVSIRSVGREAGVAHGLVSYYFDDKVGLISAALRRIEAEDVALVAPEPGSDPEERLRTALRRVADPEFLTTAYLSLRLQLWSLANASTEYERLNSVAQRRYRDGLAELIEAARPDLDPSECARRAADINVVQNGLWLTTLLGLDQDSIERAVQRCEHLAFS